MHSLAFTLIIIATDCFSCSCLHQVFGKLISGDAEPTPEQEEKALLSSPEGEEKVYNVFICILKIFISFFIFLLLFSEIIHLLPCILWIGDISLYAVNVSYFN